MDQTSLPCDGCAGRQGTVCGAFDDAGIAALFGLVRQQSFTSGQWIIEQRQPADRAFLLSSGHASVLRLTAQGRRQVIAFLFPGDFFAFSAEPVYQYGALALGDVMACLLSRRQLDTLLDRHAAAGNRLRRRMARLLDSHAELAFTLGRKQALEKVAAFIWYLHFKHHKLGHTGDECPVPMSRTDIADFLGLTGESVSRALTALRTEGVISLPEAHRIQVRDPARLRQIGIVESGLAAEPG
ncbi:MAG: Crp/Fnr family transcriptional regulator [Chromatiales bacterium]|nr:Crp/Fnr family transcriptional regulator [Chromatiales bacterium]